MGLPALTASPLQAGGDGGTALRTIQDANQIEGGLGRAVNLARMTVETRHGGLSAYSTAACMQRADGGDCLIEDSEGGFVFRIPGGPPGWQEAGKSPSRETVIRVSRDGRRVEAILYDGSPRPWKQRPKRRSGVWS